MASDVSTAASGPSVAAFVQPTFASVQKVPVDFQAVADSVLPNFSSVQPVAGNEQPVSASVKPVATSFQKSFPSKK